MLALLIEDVTLLKQRQLTAAVRFRGGATTTLTLPRPLTAQQLRATHDNVRREIDAMLDEHTDAEGAHALNQRGRCTGAGDAFDPVSVQWVRFSYKLQSLKQRLLAAGWLTRQQITAQLGIGRTTLGRWRAAGRITGRLCNDLGVGVLVEQHVDLPTDVVVGGAELLGGQRAGERQGGRGAAGEADRGSDVALFDERDVLDEQREHPLALAVRGLRVAPDGREVGGEGENALAFVLVDGEAIGRPLALVVLLRLGHGA